jgi:hypothetical protein
VLFDQLTKNVAANVARMLHKQELIQAACCVAEFYKVPTKLMPGDNPEGGFELLHSFVHNLLENGGEAEAAQCLWSPNQFTPEPASVKAVWDLYKSADLGLIMGAAKMGKSFSMGVRLFLEWVRDPMWTTIRVIGPSENHLEQNLFSHLVALHQHATLPMPGEVGDLFIGMNRRDRLSSISGVVIPKGHVRKAGRLQGGHRRPRPHPHPIFGPLSRMFIFLDEIENVTDGIWLDIDNVLSEIEEKGTAGFKLFGAYNPTDAGSHVAERAEPEKGWLSVDEDTDFRWTSKRGWEVLRIDAERCENVIEGRVVFPGLQTREGLRIIAKNAGGRDASGYRIMGRGMYPHLGMETVVIPAGMWAKWRGEFIWYRDPEPVASTDLALEGGANAIHTLGDFGLASGIKYPPDIDNPKGRTVMFKDSRGRVTPRWALQAKSQFVLPKGETVSMKNNILLVNRRAGVKPEYYACDRTGHGAGTADLLKHEWSSTIHDVNYSETAGTEKLMAEDSKTCKEQYERMYSTLWFALRQWGEFQYFLLHPSMELTELTPQIVNRRFRMQNGKCKVESKADFRSRGFGSPDEADSLTLLVHAARRGSGLVLSMKGDAVDLPGGGSIWDDDDWPGVNDTRIDVSNKSDFLDTAMREPGNMEPLL